MILLMLAANLYATYINKVSRYLSPGPDIRVGTVGTCPGFTQISNSVYIVDHTIYCTDAWQPICLINTVIKLYIFVIYNRFIMMLNNCK